MQIIKKEEKKRNVFSFSSSNSTPALQAIIHFLQNFPKFSPTHTISRSVADFLENKLKFYFDSKKSGG